jgi:hypothetical protein
MKTPVDIDEKLPDSIKSQVKMQLPIFFAGKTSTTVS